MNLDAARSKYRSIGNDVVTEKEVFDNIEFMDPLISLRKAYEFLSKPKNLLGREEISNLPSLNTDDFHEFIIT